MVPRSTKQILVGLVLSTSAASMSAIGCSADAGETEQGVEEGETESSADALNARTTLTDGAWRYVKDASGRSQGRGIVFLGPPSPGAKKRYFQDVVYPGPNGTRPLIHEEGTWRVTKRHLYVTPTSVTPNPPAAYDWKQTRRYDYALTRRTLKVNISGLRAVFHKVPSYCRDSDDCAVAGKGNVCNTGRMLCSGG